MSKFARIENGQVRELFDTLPEFHEDVMKQIIPCPDFVMYEWTYDGTNFTPPTHTVPFEEMVRQAFAKMPLDLQVKYKLEIIEANFFLDKENMQMVAYTIAQAASKLSLPDDQPVLDIINAAKSYLGV